MAKIGEVTREAVEYYLAHNSEFAKSWVVNHATEEMIDLWKLTRGLEKAHKALEHDPHAFSSFSASDSRYCVTAKMFRSLVSGKRNPVLAPKKSVAILKEMGERELFMELIRDIATELEVNALCHKILLNVSILTNSDRGSLFLVRGSGENRYLVSKLFDVTAESTLQESLHTEQNEIKVPFGKGIAGLAAQTKDTVNIKNAYEDPRFNKEVDLKTGYLTHSILCMPILNYEGDVIGVAQIINKKSGDHEFTGQDEEVFRNYLTFCGIGITNAQLFEMSVEEYKRNQMLLRLARGIFEEQTNLDKLIQKIMLEAQELLRCERCSVYLIDNSVYKTETKYQRRLSEDIVALATREKTQEKELTKADVIITKAFSTYAKDKGLIHTPSAAELAKSKLAEIARHVAVKREHLNIPDVAADARFQGCKEENGFIAHNLISMPIFNTERKVIGVATLINKCSGHPFTSNDMNMFEAFAIFCGLGIHNTQMYENAVKLMAKQSVALEVLSYHATAQAEETEKLKSAVIPTVQEMKLQEYDFNDFLLDDDETLRGTIRMFLECDIMNKFHVPYEVLCRWTCSVKKNYRPVTYHNWRHAFNVTQTMFTILTTGQLGDLMTDLEKFALLVACLCHDLDHRGTNNTFQSKVESPLAVLYSTSTMEHHHFDHCIMILNSEGNNIFENLSQEEYRKCIKILESAILSTDLALYFKKRGAFQDLVEKGERDFQDNEQKELLRGMMMTACDVAAITKPWEIQKEVAQLVASEFFEQGDMERSQLNMQPIAMMDRQKADELPKMQVGFIDAICLPIYKLMSGIFPGLDPMLDGCLNNRTNWQNEAEQNE